MARGRPRTLLALNPTAASVVAIKISVNTIDLVLADYAGRIVARERRSFDSSNISGDAFAETLVRAAKAFCDANELSDTKLLEISIAAQGVVDSSAGTIVWSPALPARNVPVVEPLSRAIGAHCMLSNDTNMIAEALHWSKPGHYRGTFAVIFIDYGVGMGLYVDNKLFVGETGAAAEIGHTSHIPGGALCRCGRHGCLEAYLGDYAIVRMARDLPPSTPPEEIPVSARTFSDLVNAAAGGDEAVLDAFHRAGVALGYGVARLAAILSPSPIILTGAGIIAYRYMEAGLRQGLEEALVEDLRKTVQIESVDWEEDLIVHGTLAQAMRRFDFEMFNEARPGLQAGLREETI
ncbi:ROK family protein [Stappia sp. GBMRC 2046]|uniref:ROK family protein n=2 Tax=Stappia sediminis TaxID=2692190 RepID=A0A7X3LUC0_9HYPH|nr:ROK family protein [Stappia sediminis]